MQHVETMVHVNQMMHAVATPVVPTINPVRIMEIVRTIIHAIAENN